MVRGPRCDTATVDAERFAQIQRSRERWADVRAPAAAWLLVRVDGRGFSRLTAERCRKPFDDGFHAAMLAVAASLTDGLQAVAWYTQSDEVTVVLPPWWDQYGRRTEKAVSLAAGIASATFSLALGAGVAAAFDARLTVADDREQVVDNLSWRVADAERNCLQNLAYWGLRQRGRSAAAATAELDGLDAGGKIGVLAGWGVDLVDVPAWQRHGVLQVRSTGPDGQPELVERFEPVDVGRPGWREHVAERLVGLEAARPPA